MNWYSKLKLNNFGLDTTSIEDLEEIIGKSRSIQKEEHNKIINFLLDLEKDPTISWKLLRKKHKYEPSKSKLMRAYFKDILWPKWANSKYDLSHLKLSHNLMNIFLSNTSVNGSYGTVNITIVTEPLDSCKYKCAFCPHGPIDGPFKAPISYLPNEPAVARGARVNYNIIEQIRTRIRDLCLLGVIHREIQNDNSWQTKCKADIRIAGGTFNSYPLKKRDEFIQHIYYAVRTIDFNDDEMPEIMSLEDEIKYHTCTTNLGVLIVGLSIETRPDEINEETIKQFNKYHLTWIELGFQSTHNDVLKKVKRGHTVEDSLKAIAMLKGKMGVKILGHFMQDLPGSTPEKDIQDFEDKIVYNNNFIQYNLKLILFTLWLSIYLIFKNPIFLLISSICIIFIYNLLNKPFTKIICLPHRCDHVKIYPTMKLPHTEIENWDIDKWNRYSETNNGEVLMKVLYTIVSNLPRWVRIARLIRDFEKASDKNQGMGFDSDSIKTNMAQLVDNRLKLEAPIQNEIKSREIRNNILNLNKIKFKLDSYKCSLEYPEYAGTEYFGSFEAPCEKDNVDRLIGLFRLRLNNESNIALLREVHVYGGYIPKGTSPNNEKIVQHRGFGKRLVRRAEIIAYFYGYKKIKVISAPGTCGYYEEKCGYHKEDRYMVKNLCFGNFIKSLYYEI